jgi:hypothetical protein
MRGLWWVLCGTQWMDSVDVDVQSMWVCSRVVWAVYWGWYRTRNTATHTPHDWHKHRGCR